MLVADGGCLGLGVWMVGWLVRPKLGNPWLMVTSAVKMGLRRGNQRAVFSLRSTAVGLFVWRIDRCEGFKLAQVSS